jgi:hypothetical protein
VAATRLQQLATAEGSTLSPMTVFVMGGVTERYRHESERLARKVPDLLHELRGPEWRNLTALMERRRAEVGAHYRWPVPPSTAPTVRNAAPQPPASGSRPAAPVAAGDLTPTVPEVPRVEPSAAHPPAQDPTATHPAANRPGPSRLVPTSWSAESVPPPGEGPDGAPDRPAPRPSSNGESPHP